MAQAAEGVTRFRLEPGDRAVYQGTVTRHIRADEGEWTVTERFALTSLATEQHDAASNSIAQLWEYDPPEVQGTNAPRWSRRGAQIDYADLDLNATTEAGDLKNPFFPFHLPAPPRAELRAGLVFEGAHTGIERNGLPGAGSEVTVEYTVASGGAIDGVPCWVIDVAPVDGLPLKLRPFLFLPEGGLASKLTLIDFSEQIWVDEDCGWVVKYSHESSRTGVYYKQRVAECTGTCTVSLASRDHLAEDELASHIDQIARLRKVEQLADHLGFGGSLADRQKMASQGAEELADFRREYPNSPYAVVVPGLQRTLDRQLVSIAEEAGE